MPPDGHRSEGTLSLSEVPYAGAKTFWLLFWRLKKVTRRKGGTLRSRYRSNGYTLKTQVQTQSAKSQTNKNARRMPGVLY